MKKLLIIAALAAVASGCATKSRAIDIKGMFLSETGQLAIGYGHVDAIPESTESAVIHYEEDVAMLKPSEKTHDIDIILTGTNAVSSAEGVVKAICEAFVAVAPRVAKSEADEKGATSTIDLAKANREAKAAASQKAEECADGSCTTGACTDGNCSP